MNCTGLKMERSNMKKSRFSLLDLAGLVAYGHAAARFFKRKVNDAETDRCRY